MMTSVRLLALWIAAAAMIAAGPPPALSSAPPGVPVHREETVIGTSVQGRAIIAVHRWTDGASDRVLALGQMHGNEKAGVEVARRLESARLPANTDLWIIATMNPDGNAANTRVNAAGVDLNRNFPHLWVRADEGTGTFSGPTALSEPETRAVADFIDRVRPRMTVSYHQPLLGVDTSGAPAARWLADLLADRTGLPGKDFTCDGGCHGTFTGWHNDVTAGSAVTVELGPRPSASALDRHAIAVLAVADETDPVGAGAIVARWKGLGAGASPLGAVTSPEYAVTGGAARDFAGGRIFWSPGTGAHAVSAQILDRFAAMGAVTSPLGFPVSGHRASRGGGEHVLFAGGKILWHPAAGAHPVWGAIGMAYDAGGAENGALGYPVEGETVTSTPGVVRQRLEFATIYWSPTAGAHTVRDGVRTPLTQAG